MIRKKLKHTLNNKRIQHNKNKIPKLGKDFIVSNDCYIFS